MKESRPLQGKKKEFQNALARAEVFWMDHALKRQIERGISRDCVLSVLGQFDLIREYPQDTPFPSGLFNGKCSGQAIHVVAAFDGERGKISVITIYRPDEEHFEADFKTRRRTT